ncbi:hypothetical protein F9L07_08685 [Pimelobacter simplex]|uniref:Uncharacterized protein n=1 Tax=Nocardioides simplex TaxID=2045 RepID=A0A7J5E0X8_NOCSI|nr:hypothetical protein [Pimelobacter simplex]KAB2811905.1 hypothetical protein F9L07_08685 [Pimelobacter simplex]
MAARGVLALVCGLLLTAGCSSVGPGPSPDEPTGAGSRVATGDPQVLQDVVDSVFTLPGRAQLRRMRVNRFVHNWGLERCGGKPPPLDGTSDRYEQGLYPDLDLIREKGFIEPDEKFTYGREECQIGDVVAQRMPTFRDWLGLTVPWDEITQSVLQDESLIPVKATMATCLRVRTRLEVSDEDPALSYMGSVNKAVLEDYSTQKIMKYSVPFADCGEDYYATLARLLEKKRPALIERHREVLEKFAAELVEVGYVP